MGDRPSDLDGTRYLVLGFNSEPWPGGAQWSCDGRSIAFGSLLSDDGTRMLGAVVILAAPDPEAAGRALDAGRYDGIEVHRWRPGGRPA